MLGFRKELTPYFVALELFSWLGLLLAILLFLISPKSGCVRVALVLNVLAFALDLYGILFGVGMVIKAFS
jgi:hypothetical protein